MKRRLITAGAVLAATLLIPKCASDRARLIVNKPPAAETIRDAGTEKRVHMAEKLKKKERSKLEGVVPKPADAGVEREMAGIDPAQIVASKKEPKAAAQLTQSEKMVQSLIEEEYELSPEGYASRLTIFEPKAILTRINGNESASILVQDYDKVIGVYFAQEGGKIVRVEEDKDLSGLPEEIREIDYDKKGRISEIRFYINKNTEWIPEDITDREALKLRRTIKMKYRDGKVQVEDPMAGSQNYSIKKAKNQVVFLRCNGCFDVKYNEKYIFSSDGQGRVTDVQIFSRKGKKWKKGDGSDESRQFSYGPKGIKGEFFLEERDFPKVVEWDAEGNLVRKIEDVHGGGETWERENNGNVLEYRRTFALSPDEEGKVNLRVRKKITLEYNEEGIPIGLNRTPLVFENGRLKKR